MKFLAKISAILFLASMSSATFPESLDKETIGKEISLVTSGLRGGWCGFYEGVYHIRGSQMRQLCFGQDFADKVTDLGMAFLSEGFAFIQMLEDGEFIVAELTDCKFTTLFYDFYDVCKVRKSCTPQAMVKRIQPQDSLKALNLALQLADVFKQGLDFGEE